MLLVPSSILDLHDLNAAACIFCAKPLRQSTVQFTPFMFCSGCSTDEVEDILAADHIFPSHGDLTAPTEVNRRWVGGRRAGIKREPRSVLNGEIATTGTRH